jgi:hypothetical protein
MIRFVRAGLAGLLTCLLAACSPGTADLVLNTDQVPAAEVLRRVSENAAGITAIEGSGSVDFESPEMGGSVFFTLALRKPDSLLIKFEGPFGMDVGFLFLSKSRYLLYNGMENTVISGVPSDAGIRWGIPLDLTVDQILDAFTGSFRLPAQIPPSRYVVDKDRFLLTYTRATGTESFWVDPSTSLITRYEKTGTSSGMSAETALPEEQGSRHMPRRITLNFTDSGRRLSVYYSSLTINPERLSFRYTIPRSATSQEGR